MDYTKIVTLVYGARKFVREREMRRPLLPSDAFEYAQQVKSGVTEFVRNGLRQLAPNAVLYADKIPDGADGELFLLCPLDGETNLRFGRNDSAISLAHIVGGEIVFGVVYCPFCRELFYAQKGKGAFYYNAYRGLQKLIKLKVGGYTENDLHVADRRADQGLVEFGGDERQTHSDNMQIACYLQSNFYDLRRTCVTSVSLCEIAAGRLDGAVVRLATPASFAAAKLILEEADGHISQWDGSPETLTAPCDIIASSIESYPTLKDIMWPFAK